MTPEGIPSDFLIEEQKGRGASQRTEWTCGPFRLRRVAMVNGEPWLADLGRGVSATGATPTEAMRSATQALRDHIDTLVATQEAAEDTLEVLP